MALKLISILTVVIFACFIYKVWEKTKVPYEFNQDDIWKVRTIEFGSRFVEKWVGGLHFLGVTISYSRSFQIAVYKLMYGNLWPFSLLYENPGDRNVTIHRDELNGVPVLIYENIKNIRQTDRPVIVYFHNGGWSSLSADISHNTLLTLSRDLGFLVISVEYRLAPESSFPAGIEDCVFVTKYVLDNYKLLSVNRRKILVAGDGAGANLAASVSLQLKSQIRMQILINPILQAFDFQTPSYRENKYRLKYSQRTGRIVYDILRYAELDLKYRDSFVSNKHLSHAVRMSKVKKYIDSKLIPSYLNITNLTSLHVISGDEHISLRVSRRLLDPLLMPLMAERLAWTASSYIVTSQYDPARDDGLMYAARLHNNSVKVKLHHYRDSFRGFIHFTRGPLKLSSAERAMTELKQFLQRHIIEHLFID